MEEYIGVILAVCARIPISQKESIILRNLGNIRDESETVVVSAMRRFSTPPLRQSKHNPDSIKMARASAPSPIRLRSICYAEWLLDVMDIPPRRWISKSESRRAGI